MREGPKQAEPTHITCVSMKSTLLNLVTIEDSFEFLFYFQNSNVLSFLFYFFKFSVTLRRGLDLLFTFHLDLFEYI